jgi:hypothetical protein
MIVIFEGPDGSGKSALAERFKETGFHAHHEGPPQRQDLLQYYAELVLNAHDMRQKTVFDRLHLGETIYGPLMRGRDLIGGAMGVTIFNRLLSAVGADVIICLPRYETCLSHWSSRSEYVISEEIFKRVYRGYENLRENYFCYDWETMSIASVYSHLARFRRTAPEGVIGSVNPTFLFVGERANHPTLDLPFFGITNSSSFLNQCLWDAGYQEWEMAFVNAYTIAGVRRPLGPIAAELRPRKIISLGKAADDVVKWSGLSGQAHVHHPQYWKRFRSNDRDEYVESLRRIRLSVLTDGDRRSDLR